MPDINKSLGATAQLTARIDHENFDPDRWLESLTHAIENYIQRNIPDVYDVRFSFPDIADRVELPKRPRTLIHFEIDDIESPYLGMGDGYVDAIYDEGAVQVTEIEARPHIINFDVGVWASANSGGVTARMRAFQHLERLFGGAGGYSKALAECDFEIRRFTGGNFIVEEIGEIPVYRVVGMELVVRVYSRYLTAPRTFVQDSIQEPGLDIDETVIVG